jgi:hypothetical protein
VPFEFIQIPANGQGSAKEELNKLLRSGRIASVRKRAMEKIRSVVIGHEPGEPGRQLEQQRQQLPRREPQQQQPVQLEQQHRVPGGSQLRPPVLDGTCLSEGLNRPLSCSHPSTGRDEMNKRPPGASRPAGAVTEAPGGHLFYQSPASQFSPIHHT